MVRSPVQDARPPGPIRPRGLLTCALLLWLAGTGCNNTCATFMSNPPNATVVIKVNSSKPFCTLNKATAPVSVGMGGAPGCGSCSGSAGAPRIFVSLRGIDAHPGRIADKDSPDWEELAPELSEKPVQVELTAQPSDVFPPGQLGEATVAAGVYRLIRLRLVPNRPAPGALVPEKNACGDAGFNCLVKPDHRVVPLTLEDVSPELRIEPERIAGGSLLVLPDVAMSVEIEFDAYSSLVVPDARGVRLIPALVARPRISWVAHTSASGESPTRPLP